MSRSGRREAPVAGVDQTTGGAARQEAGKRQLPQGGPTGRPPSSTELHLLMAWKGPGAGWRVCTVEFTVQCSSSWNAVDIRSLGVTQAAGDTPEGCPTSARAVRGGFLEEAICK